MIRVLYIGDVVGQPGRRALHDRLEHVVDRERIDFTIVNVENAAGGFGVTEAIIEELSVLPIQFIRSEAGWKISAMAWDDERPGLSLADGQ